MYINDVEGNFLIADVNAFPSIKNQALFQIIHLPSNDNGASNKKKFLQGS